MKDFTEQLASLKLARYEIRLKALDDAVLNALIGSALRGAFGQSLKNIACSVSHGECGKCILQTACVYPTIFEPTSARLKNAPRPFIFEPPIPPLTRKISKDEKMKLGIEKGEQISYGLTVFGKAIEKLPYFIYATEIFARNGLGTNRIPFALADVWARDLVNDGYRIYQTETEYIEPHGEFSLTLKDMLWQRLGNFNFDGTRLKIKFLLPLRIIRKGKLITELTFTEIFKQASLRLKLMFDTYGKPLEYDYQHLIKKAERIRIGEQNIWRHNSERWTNRQKKKLYLDGMLGEMEFIGNDLADLLPILLLGEILHIGSASSFGFGKYKISN